MLPTSHRTYNYLRLEYFVNLNSNSDDSTYLHNLMHFYNHNFMKRKTNVTFPI